MVEPARDWLVVERDGQVVGQCRLMPRAPDGDRVSVAIDGTVHPAHRRQGIGSHVVPPHGGAGPRVRRRACDLHSGDHRQRAVGQHRPRGDLRQPRDWCPHRWTFLMEADLDDDEVGTDDPPVPDGYVLSTWEGIDHEEMRAAHNVAFVGHSRLHARGAAEMWAQWVAGTRNFRPALSLVAPRRGGCRRGVRPDRGVRRDPARPPACGRPTWRRSARSAAPPPGAGRRCCCGPRCTATARRASTSHRSTSTPRTRRARWASTRGRLQDDDALDELPARDLTGG